LTPTGGAGTWSSLDANWSDGTNPDVGWNNANNDDAIFTATDVNVTVSLGEAITVNDITFNSGGTRAYTIKDSTLTINGKIIGNDSATIQANIAGANGLTVTTNGTTLTLNKANSYTGDTTIEAGTLQARATGALTAATTVIL